MNCHDRRESITRYVSGELREQSRRELERHLEDCPFCRAELSAAQSLEELLKGRSLEPAPVGLFGSVMRAVDEFETKAGSLEFALARILKRMRIFRFLEEFLALGGFCIAVILFVDLLLPQIDEVVLSLPVVITTMGIKGGGFNLTYLNPPFIILSILFGLVNVFGVPRFLRESRLLTLIRFW